jgi:hypothetical protein
MPCAYVIRIRHLKPVMFDWSGRPTNFSQRGAMVDTETVESRWLHTGANCVQDFELHGSRSVALQEHEKEKLSLAWNMEVLYKLLASCDRRAGPPRQQPQKPDNEPGARRAPGRHTQPRPQKRNPKLAFLSPMFDSLFFLECSSLLLH